MKLFTAKIGDIAEDLRSGFASGEDDPEGVVQFRMNNVDRAGAINWDKVRRVPSRLVRPELVAKDGDILFNATNSPELVGKTALFVPRNEPVTFSNHFLRIRTRKSAANPAYVARWLQREFERGRFAAMCRAWVNQASITKDQLSGLSLPLPPLEEQRRIAAILDKADTLRQKRKRAVALLDDLTKSMFLEMFGDATTSASRYSTVKFGDVAHRITYGFTQPMSHHDSGIPILTAKNIQLGYIDFENTHFTSAADFASLTDKSRPRVGDILITKDGTIGRSAILEREGAVCINQSVCLVQLRSDAVESRYVLHYLLSSGVQSRIDAMKKGNSIPHLQITELATFPIPLPPRERQLDFIRRLSQVDCISENTALQQIDTDRLFASLQNSAFSGQI